MLARSLRLRLILGGMIAILGALTLAGLGISLLFERHLARSFADDLDVHLRQLLAGLDVDEHGQMMIARAPVDPRFVRLRPH